MSPREDHYSNTEADAGRYSRAHASEDGRWIAGDWVDADDIPADGDLEEPRRG